MKITFHLEAQLRTAAGRSEISMEVPVGCTLLDGVSLLADHLEKSCRTHLLAGPGEIRSSLLIVVNGESVYSEEAPQLALRDNAEVMLMPPIAGG